MNRYAYDENRFRRWLLIAGAVPAILALLAVGFITGRGTAPSGGGRTQVVNVQSGPGPAHVVNGVPVGYAHTQAGAVAAATNYLETFYGSLVTQPDKYRAAVNEMVAPDAHSKLTSLAEANLTGQLTYITYAAQGRQVVHRVVPLAYRVESYNNGSAQVSIWAEALLAVDEALSFREVWTTTPVTTEWSGDDWRLSNIPATGGPDAFGPVPTTIQASNQSTTLPTQLADYRSYQTGAT